MKEIISINWPAVVSGILWIGGAAIITAIFSYVVFQGRNEGKKAKELLNAPFYKRSLIIAVLLIVCGIFVAFFKIHPHRLAAVKISPEDAAAAPVLNEPTALSLESLVMDPMNKGHKRNSTQIIDNTAALFWDGYINTPVFKFQKGEYVFTFSARGSNAENEFLQVSQFAKLKVTFQGIDRNGYFLDLQSETFELTREMKEYSLHFYHWEQRVGRVRILFFNDKSSKRKDRNAWLKDLKIEKVKPAATEETEEKGSYGGRIIGGGPYGRIM